MAPFEPEIVTGTKSRTLATGYTGTVTWEYQKGDGQWAGFSDDAEFEPTTNYRATAIVKTLDGYMLPAQTTANFTHKDATPLETSVSTTRGSGSNTDTSELTMATVVIPFKGYIPRGNDLAGIIVNLDE
ncbi:MAG: hypothetical protein LBM77_12025 [Spirochaetaceae bacterium]|nr:hypothetical protein [Spirochaetaceae bacterium]